MGRRPARPFRRHGFYVNWAAEGVGSPPAHSASCRLSASNEQWQTFFASCAELNRRKTVTFKQLSGLFDGSFQYTAVSRATANGRRPLERVMPDDARR